MKKFKYDIFLICPVRETSVSYLEGIETQVYYLEAQGKKVYWPTRDTNQNDSSGLRICRDNREAIKNSKFVYVIWDAKSQGCLFDLGIAFALNKPIKTIVGYMPAMTNGKSFQNMIFDWEEKDV
jgi:hypothetical protein